MKRSKQFQKKLKNIRNEEKKYSKESAKMVGGKHIQHSKQFQNELNSTMTPASPFRYYDEVWTIGKYKGIKLSNTPISYIKWALTNMKMPPTAKSMLNKYI